MNIHYLSSSALPSQTANSVHVMKMCSAFAGLGHTVTLYGRPGPMTAKNLHDFYNVDNDFDIVLTQQLAIREIIGADQAVCTLCDPEDADAWERALRNFAAEPALRKDKGDAAYALLTTTYSWRQRARVILEALLPNTR